MLNQVAAAFNLQDYRTAAQLLQTLMEQTPEDEWVRFYQGRLAEVSGQLTEAEQIYRQILKTTTNLRLTNQLRQAIQRVQEIEREQRQRAIAQAITDPSNVELGCLILEPLDPATKVQVASGFGRLMRLDHYTARLHLPSRCWRLYRTGPLGELKVYVQELKDLGIPAFCVGISQIESIQVFRVEALQVETNETIAICRNAKDQQGTFSFDWSEIKLQVEGLLPIFESVVDLAAWRKLVRKEKTQDYVHMLDFHLPQRNCILRLCDRTYQFYLDQENLADTDRLNRQMATNRLNWNQLVSKLSQYVHQVETCSGFMHFAESAFDQEEFLNQIRPHIDLFRLDLFRRDQPSWDAAFQLFSTLAFIKTFQ